MSGVAVLGTYDADARHLFGIDLMRYLAAHGHSPFAIIFRTGGAPRPDIPLNRVHALDRYRSVVQVTDFNDPAAVVAIRSLRADLLVYAGGRDLL
ncbi:MAG TPA: hypothetical protein VK504_16235, partial [Vicinamibacterales bacterium]|nr:hypothetical protein [Vicinamibacterales bacterium]